MPAHDPRERTLAARAAAHTSWARTPDRSARTAPGRAALQARFEAEVDPEGVLPPDERARRADSARAAYFSRLALRSAKARRKAAAARRDAVDLERDANAADEERAAGGDVA